MVQRTIIMVFNQLFLYYFDLAMTKKISLKCYLLYPTVYNDGSFEMIVITL